MDMYNNNVVGQRMYKSLLGILMVCFFVAGCKKLVEIPLPENELVNEKVFEEDATAMAVMAGIYARLAGNQSFADGNEHSITIYEGLYADELTSYLSSTNSSPNVAFYFNNVLPDNVNVSNTWNNCYNIIYECNRILEGLNHTEKLTPAVKSRLIGEALFMRAFCHFYLVNLFGDVPLLLSSDYITNARAPRTAIVKVYERIVTDLAKAKEFLPDSYPGSNRGRINKGAITALLARAYLYNNDYPNAEKHASEVIDKTQLYTLESSLDVVFINTSREAIWQLLPNGGLEKFTHEAMLFILKGQPTRFSLNNNLALSFEINDLRKVNWVDSIRSTSGLTTWYFAHKYKQVQANGTAIEYSMVLRLAEQYLIRAEARAYQNKLIGNNSAESDINMIRARAGLPATKARSKEELLSAILRERRMELFTEWGHRFFDLKRMGKLDTVLGPVKSNWKACKALLPIPISEILLNSNLNPQNECY